MLAGIGTAFIAAPDPVADASERNCVLEGDCTFTKPNLMIMVDYSSSMNEAFGEQTRWSVVVDAITAMIDADNGFLADNLNVALMRIGHDPDPDVGTLLIGDESEPPITDGQALDVHWYPLEGEDVTYQECNGEAVKAALEALPTPACLPHPSGEGCSGIGTWTKGALDRGAQLIAESRAAHGEELEDRIYLNLVLTDGSWTGPDGVTQDPTEDPSITAASLFDEQGVATYVVAVSGGADLALADELAVAGGTVSAIDASTPEALVAELQGVVMAIKDEIVQPDCVGGMPRIMIVLDASSSMLNRNGTAVTQPGVHGWDQARETLAGVSSIFDLVVDGGDSVEDLSQLGLLVFGGVGLEGPIGEERVLVDYGPCRKDNFAWALDPYTSCEAPECTDPYAGPPIQWTYRDGSAQAPWFDERTLSHMPQCWLAVDSSECRGSGTYTHRGLELAASNQLAYAAAAADPDALYPANDATVYANILITDGNYEGASTDAEVQAALELMYNRGIVTYVLGFGEYGSFVDQLDQMQRWGSGGSLDVAFTASDEAELQNRLEAILSDIELDPCCGFNDCSEEPEPTTDEPDTMTGGSGDGGGSEGSGGGSETSGGMSAGLPASSSGSDSGGATALPVDEVGCGCRTHEAPAERGAAWIAAALLVLRRSRRRARRLSRGPASCEAHRQA